MFARLFVSTFVLLAANYSKAQPVKCEDLNPLFSCKSANVLGHSLFVIEPLLIVDAATTAKLQTQSDTGLCRALGYSYGTIGNSTYPDKVSLFAILDDTGDVQTVYFTGDDSAIKTLTCRK